MITVPNEKIAAISYDKAWQSQEHLDSIFESLNGKRVRDWFINHVYHCLPLVIGNQYGFILKSLYDFEAEWSGGDSVNDVTIKILSDREKYIQTKSLQNISSHFGMGLITVQTCFTLRTPPGINLITINPPNLYIDGLYHLTGVVESDNLRRDFTYNLRITRPNHIIKVKRGDPIGCIIPYPRHFIDNYTIVDSQKLFSEELLQEERQCMSDFAHARMNIDKFNSGGNGKKYWRGEDIYDNKFTDHQIKLDDNLKT